ncbi:hypothetical protein Tco_0121403 [Tanacetum coccineum]
MFYPRFMKIIIHHFLKKDKSISMRNRMFMHTARDDSLLGTMRFVSRHGDTQVYGAVLPKAMTNKALLDSVAYKTYYAIASGAEPLKLRKSVAPKPKSTKKKASVKADRGKGLNVLSEVALSEAALLNEVAKRRKKDLHISYASGSGDGTDFESGVPDEQHHKNSGTNEGTSTKPGVPDVPKYDYESKKESWGDGREEDDDDENDSEDESDNDDSDGNDGNDGDGDDDANDDDNQEDDDKNDDEEETNNDRTKSDRIKIHVLNQSSTKYYEEEVEKIDDEEKMDEEEDDEVTKELYNDVNMNLGNRDADMTNADQGVADQQNKTDEPVQSSSVSSDFTSKLLNLEKPSLTDNEIASLMDTTVHHEEPRSQTSSLYTIVILTTNLEKLSKRPFWHIIWTVEKKLKKMDYIELVDTLMRAILKEEANTKLPQILPQAVPDFATLMIEKNRSRDDKDKDQDPSAGSDQGTKKRKSSKEAESSKDLSHTVDDSGGQQNQEFNTGNNDEQPVYKEKYDYGHLEEIKVCREDQHLYTFREGDFPRLRLQDIEDMLLLLVQQRLTNLTINKRPHGMIYVDQFDRKRLMRTNELHKFSDGTLNDIRTALYDIYLGIMMKYLPKRKWSRLDKKRARVMVQDIDKQLYEIRLMWNLEKFVGGRENENDLRLRERTI